MCRCEKNIDSEALKKISLICNVKKENVIPAMNSKSIYEVPILYYNAGLDKAVLNELGYNEQDFPLDLKPWKNVVKKYNEPSNHINIAVVGKYTDLKDSYKSLSEALIHGGLKNKISINIIWINAERLQHNEIIKQLKNANGILVPGGFGERGIEGKILSITFTFRKDRSFKEQISKIFSKRF